MARKSSLRPHKVPLFIKNEPHPLVKPQELDVVICLEEEAAAEASHCYWPQTIISKAKVIAHCKVNYYYTCITTTNISSHINIWDQLERGA